MSAEMLGDPNKVVPASELRRLTQGSYQQRIAEVAAWGREHWKNARQSLIAVDDASATFCVEGDDGGDMFIRVQLEKSDNGNLTRTDQQVLEVDVRDKDDLNDYVEAEAVGIVNLWIAGQPEKAKSKLKELVPQVQWTPIRAPEDIISNVESVLSADQPWKAAFVEREAQIKALVGSDLTEDRLRPKFRKLYDGTVEDEKLEGFRPLVSEDVQTVIARYAQLQEDTETAFEDSYTALLEAQTEESDDSAVLDLYEGFARDLLLDFDRVSKQTQIALRSTEKDVRCQGRLRDVLAEGIAPYEGASRFVVKVADLLTQAQED